MQKKSTAASEIVLRFAMPPFVYFAAAAILQGDHASKKRRQRSESRKNSSRSDCSGSNGVKTNPLLHRYLQQQSSVVPLLRKDLQCLPRAGKTMVSLAENFEGNFFSAARESISSDGSFDTCFSTGAESSKGPVSTVEARGLSVSDYIWANSDIGKLRIEAMYI
jgi:hypothetical protein